ncbi:MAG: hypothetical protein IJV56_05795 [Neisseriaceae bacterium]|nr:hypothetical protein [Neisseriaceae bacterium]
MTMTLQQKISHLPPVLRNSAENYIDFLLTQITDDKQEENTHLDFSKYHTNTHLWNLDAQQFVQELRNEERF